MSADDIRELMRKKFTAISAREWCKVMNVHHSHLSEFLRGKRDMPPSDLLKALNLTVKYVRRKGQ